METIVSGLQFDPVVFTLRLAFCVSQYGSSQEGRSYYERA